jgi:CheY-like chemotaxis protein
VTLRFPLVADASALTTRDVTAVSPHALKGRRSLVVEDGDDARDATRAMVERLGAEVVVASDGLDALAAVPYRVRPCSVQPLYARHGRIRVSPATAASAQASGASVVALSGLARSADHRRTHAAGFAEHIDKPFDDEALSPP